MSLWHELNLAGKAVAVVGVLVGVLVVGGIVLQFLPSTKVAYVGQTAAVAETQSPPVAVVHIKTPESVRAMYMTACTASVPKLRNRLLDIVKGTEINSLVIDVKDYTGTLAYNFPNMRAPKGPGCRISDLPQFLADLHAKGIYTIARVTVFQDPLYAALHPDIAVQSLSRPGTTWKDKNGLAYIDPNFPAYWERIVSIAKDTYALGFDEINFDYIRFPSDGDMTDAGFATPIGVSKSEVMKGFFAFLNAELGSSGIVTSADLFGQTTVTRNDLGIGQILEDALPYFDYIAPMNYPSHFIKGFLGYPNPALKPYEVMKETMVMAVERTIVASSSISKLRPWLQAFDLGAVYTPEMVRAQIQGVYDAGLTSWMLWDASNHYSSYKKEGV